MLLVDALADDEVPAPDPLPVFEVQHQCPRCQVPITLTPDSLHLMRNGILWFQCKTCAERDNHRPCTWTHFKHAPEEVRKHFQEAFDQNEARRKTERDAKRAAVKALALLPQNPQAPAVPEAPEQVPPLPPAAERPSCPSCGKGMLSKGLRTNNGETTRRWWCGACKSSGTSRTDADMATYDEREVDMLRGVPKGSQVHDLVADLKRQNEDLRRQVQAQTMGISMPGLPAPGLGIPSQSGIPGADPSMGFLMQLAAQMQQRRMMERYLESAFSGNDGINLDKIMEKVLLRSLLQSFSPQQQYPYPPPQQQPSLVELATVLKGNDPWQHIAPMLLNVVKERGPPPGMDYPQMLQLITTVQGLTRPNTDAVGELTKALAAYMTASGNRQDPSIGMLQNLVSTLVANQGKSNGPDPLALLKYSSENANQGLQWQTRYLMDSLNNLRDQMGHRQAGDFDGIVKDALGSVLKDKLAGTGNDKDLGATIQKILNSPIGEAMGAGGLMLLQNMMQPKGAPGMAPMGMQGMPMSGMSMTPPVQAPSPFMAPARPAPFAPQQPPPQAAAPPPQQREGPEEPYIAPAPKAPESFTP